MTDPGDSNDVPAGLLARVAQGEAHAMESCIEIYGGLVWSLVLHRVRDRSAAEDLTQEIFTEVWKSASRYDPSIAPESGFIAVIARRRTIDWLRRQQRLPEMETLLESTEFAVDEPSPGVDLDRETLWQALDYLPDETRRLFTLHFEQGMTHGEISAKTGLPLGSVKTRLRRGLIEVRRLLKRIRAGVGLSPEMLP